MVAEELLSEQVTGFMSGISPTLIIIGIFTMAIGVFVSGIKFMFWGFFEVDILIERWKNRVKHYKKQPITPK